MTDPVVAADGWTYQRTAIGVWLFKCHASKSAGDPALFWPTHLPLDYLLQPDVHDYALLADRKAYVSPMTGEKMQSLILLPDHSTRRLVKQHTDDARRWSVLGDCKC